MKASDASYSLILLSYKSTTVNTSFTAVGGLPAVGIVIFTSSPGRQKKKSRTSPVSSFIR